MSNTDIHDSDVRRLYRPCTVQDCWEHVIVVQRIQMTMNINVNLEQRS